jgi:hypothetical protein
MQMSSAQLGSWSKELLHLLPKPAERSIDCRHRDLKFLGYFSAGKTGPFPDRNHPLPMRQTVQHLGSQYTTLNRGSARLVGRKP